MNFKLNHEADVNGTSLQGYFSGAYSRLEELFGEAIGDDYKVSSEWVFESDSGDVVTLYDYKETDLYSSGLPSVEAFRSWPSYAWHIGAKSEAIALKFKHWLNNQLNN